MGVSVEAIAAMLLPAIGSGLGVYVAMRVDLARVELLARLAHEGQVSAHQRIDRITEK